MLWGRLVGGDGRSWVRWGRNRAFGGRNRMGMGREEVDLVAVTHAISGGRF